MSIYTTLFDLNACLANNNCDPATSAILLQRDDFERMRDAISKENPVNNWNYGSAFEYGGITFIDGGAWVYARAH